MDLEKAFERIQRKLLEWTMRKKGIPDVLVRLVMSLYEGTKAKVLVDSELFMECEYKSGDASKNCAVTFTFYSCCC